MPPARPLNTLQGEFNSLVQKPLNDQLELFLKSFIFDLGDDWKHCVELSKRFQKYLDDLGESVTDLNAMQAADFLQKEGKERTGLQRKEEVRDIDLDNNDRITFIEYLLLHYKALILKAYYKRTGDNCPFDLDEETNPAAVGIVGVGHQLLDELFTMPAGLPPELIAAIEELMRTKSEREKRMKTLSVVAAGGGVKALAAKNEIEQMNAEDLTSMNRLEITLNAAKRRASRDTGEAALRKKKQEQEQQEKAKRDASRAAMAARTKMFEQQ